jgi:integral membrane sensor domain MASE1
MKQKILFAAVMGAITTALVSFTLVVVNKGFNDEFLSIWLKSWLISYTVAVPTIILIAPRVQSFLNRLAP